MLSLLLNEIGKSFEEATSQQRKEYYQMMDNRAKCPTCGKMSTKEIINNLTECLSCDHVRADTIST